MWSRRLTSLTLFLGLLVLSMLFGCRAFEPEVVIVNNPPETYLIGAPAETSGAFFHFHVFWYGSDQDGRVERFVWALTDTTIQDLETDEDEEDQNFNPATNISTLEIANWTTRTDTVFDFRIDQGATQSYDMTLHMVAQDDRGDYDRTPARLHFISNALANPQLTFWLQRGVEMLQVTSEDTVAYGQAFSVMWEGTSGNVDPRFYSPELLAERDTVPPLDGLYGFKYRLLDEPCDEASQDCWKPRRFDETIGDSVSVWGEIDSLYFSNDGSGTRVQRMKLPSGPHQIRVNTLDVAGVEVPATDQIRSIRVNYDPETELLIGAEGEAKDPFPDGRQYPYYRIFNTDGTLRGEFTFAQGETIPDRAYVVFKARGRDDARDEKAFPDSVLRFQGQFEAVGTLSQAKATYTFETDFSRADTTSAWTDTAQGNWSADTLGFHVGPFAYTFLMRAVDEHGRRDGTPDRFQFYANRPPCVQCIDLTNLTTPSDYDTSGCYDGGCLADVDTLWASAFAVPPGEAATNTSQSTFIWFNETNGAVWLNRPPAGQTGIDSVRAWEYTYRAWLYGRDDELEAPMLSSRNRVLSWRYQLDYDNDGTNVIRDGGGQDDLENVTYNFSLDSDDPVYIDEDGVWIMRFHYNVPQWMLFFGESAYRDTLLNRYGSVDRANRIFDLTTKAMGGAELTVVARDAAECDLTLRPLTGMYHYYYGVRPAINDRDNIGRSCTQTYADEKQRLELDDFARESAEYTKRFYLKVLAGDGTQYPAK